MKIPSAAISRLVTYLRILDELESVGVLRTSSDYLAQEAQVTAFQVRKDLSYFGSYGTRGVGYTVPVLRRELRYVLGLHRRWNLAIVGMGRIGQALAHYPGLSGTFELMGLYDTDPQKLGQPLGSLTIQPVGELAASVASRRIEVGLIAVPADNAQEVANQMVEAGLRGILNFAPVVLDVPREVVVENVDFLAGLTRLSFFLLNPRLHEEMMG